MAIMGLFMLVAPSGTPGMGGGLAMLIIGPVLYALFGFLFSLLGGWIYNMIAAQIGGFEYTSQEVSGN